MQWISVIQNTVSHRCSKHQKDMYGLSSKEDL